MHFVLSKIDVLVLLKIVAKGGQKWTQPELAYELSVSQSAVSNALSEAEALRIYAPTKRRLYLKHFEDALLYGARYFLTAKQGGEVRGLATAWAASPLSEELASADLLPPVWPDPMGTVRGLSIEPLHPRVPEAVKRDPALYELLALLDVFRIGGEAREINLAKKALHERLRSHDRLKAHG